MSTLLLVIDFNLIQNFLSHLLLRDYSFTYLLIYLLSHLYIYYLYIHFIFHSCMVCLVGVRY